MTATHQTQVLINGKPELAPVIRDIEPTVLEYDIEADTRNLHRSIYDIMVYQSGVRMRGSFRTLMPRNIM